MGKEKTCMEIDILNEIYAVANGVKKHSSIECPLQLAASCKERKHKNDNYYLDGKCLSRKFNDSRWDELLLLPFDREPDDPVLMVELSGTLKRDNQKGSNLRPIAIISKE
jgi:hypothetical protein